MTIEPFTVEHEGKTYYVNPADYPDEYAWAPLDDTWTACMTHQHRVFNTRDASTGVRMVELEFGHPIFAIGMCVDCLVERERRPLQSEVGLEELPEWWTPSQVRHIETNALLPALWCTEHTRHFEPDRCCRRCIDEDNEADA